MSILEWCPCVQLFDPVYSFHKNIKILNFCPFKNECLKVHEKAYLRCRVHGVLTCTPWRQHVNTELVAAETKTKEILTFLLTTTNCTSTQTVPGIRRIRPFLSQEATQLLVHNAAAPLIFSLPKFTHMTPLLRFLHWLPVAA